MKKILILLLIGLYSISGIFSADEQSSDIPQDADINDYIDMFTDGAFEDVILTEVLDEETIAALDSPETQATLTEALEEAGVDDEMKADTLKLVDLIAAGDLDQLSDLDDPDWQAANPDVDFTLEDISDGIVVFIADQVTNQLFTGDQEESMKETMKTLANGLKMLSEFGQANAQSSVSSSLFGYQGYKLFTASFGMLGSVAADASTMDSVSSLLNNPDTATKEIEARLAEGGFAAGFAMQGFTASIGLNLSWLVDKLYIGAVFGSVNIDVSGESGTVATMLGSPIYEDPEMTDVGMDGVNLSLETSTFGLTVNYQLIRGFGIPILFRWNGLSLGTGFIANTFNVNAEIESLGSLLGGDESEEGAPDLSAIQMGAKFGINNSSYTIPFEASTGIQLLSILTVTAGAGVDLKFGTSNVSFELISEDPDDLLTSVMSEVLNQALIESGTGITFPYNSEGEIQLINPRLMAGIGIGLGPVIVDFSLGYYIFSGMTFGANFILRI